MGTQSRRSSSQFGSRTRVQPALLRTPPHRTAVWVHVQLWVPPCDEALNMVAVRGGLGRQAALLLAVPLEDRLLTFGIDAELHGLLAGTCGDGLRDDVARILFLLTV